MTQSNGSARAMRRVQTPLGLLSLLAGDSVLIRACWQHQRYMEPMDAPEVENHEVLDQAERELDLYFSGRLRRFSTPVAPEGTSFQKDVWQALCAIPCGQTRSYADIARAVGRPAAVRAVGAANARNPITLIVPCHRVIGSSGALTGYGGGLPVKEWLLAHERRAPAAAA